MRVGALKVTLLFEPASRDAFATKMTWFYNKSRFVYLAAASRDEEAKNGIKTAVA